MQNTDAKIKSKRILFSAVSALLVVCVLLISFGGSLGIPGWNRVFSFFGIYADTDSGLSVSFINVGSADAAYIKCGNKNILIDAGESITTDKLKAYLKRNNCTHFDAVIVSHPDSDHIGGMSEILSDFGADTLYMYSLQSKIIPQTEEYKNFNNSIKENKINVVNPEINTDILLGELKIKFISPVKGYDNTNDSSLVIKLTYGKTSFLFTGDISDKVEKSLVNSNIELKSDVLKVAHHGSKTSSCAEFLKAVSPKVSVVSVAAYDSALPDYETMARIKAYSNSLYSTADDKTIVVTSDKTNIKVQTHA